MHMIRTAFVALTEFPQHGHFSFLVLLFFGGVTTTTGPPVLPAPLLPPLLGGGAHPQPPRLISISVHPFSSMYSSTRSDGVVIVHP